MTLIKHNGNWIEVAGGTRMWVGTKAQLDTALTNGELSDGTPVMVTDDFEESTANIVDKVELNNSNAPTSNSVANALEWKLLAGEVASGVNITIPTTARELYFIGHNINKVNNWTAFMPYIAFKNEYGVSYSINLHLTGDPNAGSFTLKKISNTSVQFYQSYMSGNDTTSQSTLSVYYR